MLRIAFAVPVVPLSGNCAFHSSSGSNYKILSSAARNDPHCSCVVRWNLQSPESSSMAFSNTWRTATILVLYLNSDVLSGSKVSSLRALWPRMRNNQPSHEIIMDPNFLQCPDIRSLFSHWSVSTSPVSDESVFSRLHDAGLKTNLQLLP